ncbi:ethyl tert-butyl ether degradation EthD [Caballeronia fortuita]|uniref:Ethyl tert-butyl ether degradation EthD n=1 Tax=Caballeronia fortuita TaxID=1777138 RepID=A0A158E0J9_9BURK|nr:EthD family reductase [Caballeronia fortuita]SAL00372.1 ethyl tert-butyl ether degradation EthD [Caballeronia fortuita]
MTKLIVVCTGDKTTRFDRNYYATRHLSLAMECWGQYGLEAADAFYPAGEGDGWVSIGVYRFRDHASIDAALASPEMERIMADVNNFTDSPLVMRTIFSPL